MTKACVLGGKVRRFTYTTPSNSPCSPPPSKWNRPTGFYVGTIDPRRSLISVAYFYFVKQMGVYAALGVGQALTNFVMGMVTAFTIYFAAQRLHHVRQILFVLKMIPDMLSRMLSKGSCTPQCPSLRPLCVEVHPSRR